MDDIGAITAQSIVDWFASPQSQHLIARLKEAGVNMQAEQKGEDQRFAGKTFVLTGTLDRFTRAEATKMIEDRGAKRPPPCPRRPPMWWRGRLPAPSCARPRSWASRCLPRRNFLPCSAAGPIRINYKKGHRSSRRAGALFVFCCIGCVERGERYAGTDTL